MCSVPALKAAVHLLQFPSQAALIRAGPLPEGVLILLRIAAGDEEAVSQTEEGWSRDAVREAAVFFLEQVLLHPDSDSYRVLGASSGASHGELRHNLSLLLQWLHPDLDRREARSVFVSRVTRAWNDLKTPERRAAYDRALQSARAKKSASRLRRQTQASIQRHVHKGGYGLYAIPRYSHTDNVGLLRRIAFFLFGGSAH
jgi:hypothetical protein